MISANKARNLSALNIGKPNTYPYDSILRAALQGQTKISVPTDLLRDHTRQSLIENGYTLTDNEIGETEISWE